MAAILAVATIATTARSAGDVFVQGIDVAAAVAEALERNPELKAARAELDVARGQLVKARSLNQYNPTIGGALGSREFDDGGSDTQVSAEVSLEVEVAGQRSQRSKAATRRLDVVQANVEDAARLLKAEVKEAFYGAVYARERLRLASDVETLAGRLSNAAAARFRAGEAPKTEPNLSRIRHSQARSGLLTAERHYGDALRNLERLLGREPAGAIVPAGDLRFAPAAIPDAVRLVERALEARPDLRAWAAEITRIDAEQALTQRLAVPNVTLGAFYEDEAEADGSRDRIIGGGLTIPLPLFDRQQGELAGLAGQRSQVEYQRQAAALAVRAEVGSALRAYGSAAQSIATYEADTLDLIDESVRFIEVAYREGKSDLLELIVVQNDLADARAGYFESLYEGRLAEIALERAVGAEIFTDTLTANTDKDVSRRRR